MSRGCNKQWHQNSTCRASAAFAVSVKKDNRQASRYIRGQKRGGEEETGFFVVAVVGVILHPPPLCILHLPLLLLLPPFLSPSVLVLFLRTCL